MLERCRTTPHCTNSCWKGKRGEAHNHANAKRKRFHRGHRGRNALSQEYRPTEYGDMGQVRARVRDALKKGEEL